MSARDAQSLPTAGAGILSPPYRALTIGAVVLVAASAFEAIAVTTAMPAVATALRGLPLYALAFGVPLATGVVGMVLSGGWSDAKGPAAPLTVGLACFITGLVAAGLAPVMSVLVLGRAVQGLGSGLITVALYVVVAIAYPERLHPRIFSAFAAAWVLPGVIGPAVSGLVVDHLGWRWVFLGVPMIAMAAAALAGPQLRKVGGGGGRQRAGRAGSRAGWAAGVGGGACLLHVAGQRTGVAAAALLAAAAVLLAAGTPRLLPAGTFLARRGLPTVVAVRGLASAAFVGTEVFLPLLLSRERGMPPALAGLILTTAALSWATGSWWQGRVVRPELRPILLRVGLVCIVFGIGCAALTVWPPVPTAVAIAGWGIAGLGMGLAYPTLSVLTLELSAAGEQGRNSSALQISDALLASVALALAGTVFAALVERSHTAPYLAGFAIAGSAALAGALIAHRVRPPAGPMVAAAAAATASALHMIPAKVCGTTNRAATVSPAVATHNGADGQRAPAATWSLTSTNTSA